MQIQVRTSNPSFHIVANMNEAFGNHVGVRTDVNWNRVTKQCMNIQDEIDELKIAVNQRHPLNVRDALCDICVFAYGAYHFIGIPASEIRPLSVPRSYAQFAAALNNLDRAYSDLMLILTDPEGSSVNRVIFFLDMIVDTVAGIQEGLGVRHDVDMKAVIDGVMTRFVKNEEDKQATIAKHAAKGITQVYFEGQYPTMIMKSSEDQPDAPQGKFLKSASFSEPVFPELEGPVLFSLS